MAALLNSSRCVCNVRGHNAARNVSVAAFPASRDIQPEPIVARRALLGLSAALTALTAIPVPSFASPLCSAGTETEEEDTECRRNQLALDGGKQQSYAEVSSRKFELAPNVPVADLDQEYISATLKLADDIEKYCTLDVYDKGRIPLIKTLKADGTQWVVKYARGGSARSLSARRMYIAVDSVIGHLSSNGYAPLPAIKVKAAKKSLTEALEFLAKGV